MKCEEQIIELFKKNLDKVYFKRSRSNELCLDMEDNKYSIDIDDYDFIDVVHYTHVTVEHRFRKTEQYKDSNFIQVPLSKSLRKRIETMEKILHKRDNLVHMADVKHTLKKWGVCK